MLDNAAGEIQSKPVPANAGTKHQRPNPVPDIESKTSRSHCESVNLLKSKKFAERIEWIGEEFNPHEFDLEFANTVLANRSSKQWPPTDKLPRR
jgi:hypothetical protein